jgi:hypothetical protein
MKAISDAIHNMSERHTELYSVSGVVSSINIEEMTCTVSIEGEADLHGVKIQTMEGGNKGVKLVPKLNSEVIVTYMSPATAYIAMASELSEFGVEIDTCNVGIKDNQVSIKQGTAEIKVSNGKIQISSNGIDLGTTLSQLIDAISAITVTCTAPGSPSTPPINVAQIQAIKAQLSLLL